MLNKTNTIGLVIPDINNPFFAQLAKVLGRPVAKNWLPLILVNSDDHFAAEKELIQLLIDRNVDGLLLALSSESYTYEEELKRVLSSISVPLVLVDRGLDNFPVGQVFYNNRQGGYLATMELINNGHQNIGIMMNPEKKYQLYLSLPRISGCSERKRSCPARKLAGGLKFQFEDAYDKADQLLNNQAITGIVAGK